MNSPERRDDDDDRFERRIPDALERHIVIAARALRGKAPDVLARVRADARDLDASVDAATNSLAPTAPAAAWAAIRARIADPDAALDAAARTATPTAPPIPFHELLARSRATDPHRRRVLRRRLLLLRGGPLAAAAAIVVMALLLTRERGTAPVSGGPSLLTAGQLATATKEEDRLALEADQLAKSVANGAAGAPAVNEEGQALLEEKEFLDDAIAECRTALAANQRHPQLRQQLEELSRQRVDLLHRIVAVGKSAPSPADGEGR